MKVRIKKLHEDAVIPNYSNPHDAGMDLVAVSKVETLDYIEYGTGLALEIPNGYAGLIFPRSSISKFHLTLANSVGVIDSGYRDEVKCRFVVSAEDVQPNIFENYTGRIILPRKYYEVGDRVAQLIILPYPKIVWEVADDLTETARGVGGFGSSGR